MVREDTCFLSVTREWTVPTKSALYSLVFLMSQSRRSLDQMPNWYSENVISEELGPLQKLLWNCLRYKCGNDITRSAFSLRLETVVYLITTSNLLLVLLTSLEITATAQATIQNLSCSILTVMAKQSSTPSDPSRALLNPGFLNEGSGGSTDRAPRDPSSKN